MPMIEAKVTMQLPVEKREVFLLHKFPFYGNIPIVDEINGCAPSAATCPMLAP